MKRIKYDTKTRKFQEMIICNRLSAYLIYDVLQILWLDKSISLEKTSANPKKFKFSYLIKYSWQERIKLTVTSWLLISKKDSL